MGLQQEEPADRVRKIVVDSKPFMLVVSPPCTPFSRLQELSVSKYYQKIVEAEKAAGRVHMKFCFERCTSSSARTGVSSHTSI